MPRSTFGSLLLFVLVLLVLHGASDPVVAEEADPATRPAEPEVVLTHPKPAPREVFREGLIALREALHADLEELRLPADPSIPTEQRLAADLARRARKHRYEMDLLRLQLDLAVAEESTERVQQITETLTRLQERADAPREAQQ